MLQDLERTFAKGWLQPDAKPTHCFIGCPHLSLRQVQAWAGRILERLAARPQERLAVHTVLCAAPAVIEEFRGDHALDENLRNAGVCLSPSCAETLFEADVCMADAIITNSCKLKAYSSARYFPDQILLEILVNGELPGGS